jgi:hypothetical protein
MAFELMPETVTRDAAPPLTSLAVKRGSNGRAEMLWAFDVERGSQQACAFTVSHLI